MQARLHQQDTPLARALKERIRQRGPMTVHDYMQACLLDPEHGYYRGRDAIGASGDFITAPEISQVFGELLGLWMAVVWGQMGSPPAFDIVELGPGRGALMADALRAARMLPGFRKAGRIHLVEINPLLAKTQSQCLAAADITYHHHPSLAAYASGCPHSQHSKSQYPGSQRPLILLANEFLDAFPVRQFVFAQGHFKERLVTLDHEGAFELIVAETPTDESIILPRPPAAGDVIEICPGHDADILAPLRDIASHSPIAALFIDYGHAESQPGETMQAVRSQGCVSIFESPGHSDLSCQVDFARFRAVALVQRSHPGAPLAVDGPVTQAEFLGRLGIAERASRLMAANPASAASIEAGIMRLLSPGGMGGRFKVIGIRSPALAPLPGLSNCEHI